MDRIGTHEPYPQPGCVARWQSGHGTTMEKSTCRWCARSYRMDLSAPARCEFNPQQLAPTFTTR